MAATIETASEVVQPRERRALVLAGLLQSKNEPCFAELETQLHTALDIETDTLDAMTTQLGPIPYPIDDDPKQLVYDYSPADHLRDVIEFTYQEHPEADYISMGFCRGGNLALELGAHHSEDGYHFRGSGPIVAFAPSTKFLQGIDAWHPSRDRDWQRNTTGRHSAGFNYKDELADWRTFKFPGSDITYHATTRVLRGWLEPGSFFTVPRSVHLAAHERCFGNFGADEESPELMSTRAERGLVMDLSRRAHFIKQDVLLVFGDRDTVSPPKTGEKLLSMLGSTASDMMVVSADHDDFWNNPEVYERVFAKVVDWLGPRLGSLEAP